MRMPALGGPGSHASDDCDTDGAGEKDGSMTFGLAARITMALVVILAAGVAMTAILSAHMFERTLSDFLTSRFEFELNDLRQRIETQMDLGIELANLQSVPEELEEYAHADEQILSIEVLRRERHRAVQHRSQLRGRPRHRRMGHHLARQPQPAGLVQYRA